MLLSPSEEVKQERWWVEREESQPEGEKMAGHRQSTERKAGISARFRSKGKENVDKSCRKCDDEGGPIMAEGEKQLRGKAQKGDYRGKRTEGGVISWESRRETQWRERTFRPEEGGTVVKSGRKPKEENIVRGVAEREIIGLAAWKTEKKKEEGSQAGRGRGYRGQRKKGVEEPSLSQGKAGGGGEKGKKRKEKGS